MERDATSRAAVHAAALRVLHTIEDEGDWPEGYRLILARHRLEWPDLWDALDRLRDAAHR